jgi:phosphate transport system permease protein
MIPIMTCAMAEVVALVPREMKETSYGLGATRWESTLAVVVRQSLPGLITAILLAFGRGIGDAASVMFTAGFSGSIPTSLTDSTASLPMAVYVQITSPYNDVQDRGYASALVLLVLVLLISLVSRLIGRRFSRHVIR